MRLILFLSLLVIFIFASCKNEELVDSQKSGKYYYSSNRKKVLYEVKADPFDIRQLWRRFYEEVPTNPNDFEVLSTHYGKDKESIFCKYLPLKEADYSSFYIDTVNNLGKDSKHVFVVSGNPIYFIVEGADSESYSYIGNNPEQWAKDRNYCYFFNKKIDADVESFFIINDFLAGDKDFIYFSKYTYTTSSLKSYPLYGKPISLSRNIVYDDKNIYCLFPVSKQNSKEIETYPYENINSLKFHSQDSSVFSFDNKVYWLGSLVENADAASFESIDRRYSKDNESVFWNGKRMIDADPATFQIKKENDLYALDSRSVYYRGVKLENSDITTFRFINDIYSIDKNQVYIYGNIIEGVDVNTFEIISRDHHLSKDGKYVYLDKNIVPEANPHSFHLKKGEFSIYKDGKNEWKWSPGGNADSRIERIK